MVGFAPGGGIDTMARIVAQGLSERFGYQIVVENRPGAASNIAAKAIAGAPAGDPSDTEMRQIYAVIKKNRKR